ncbi:hypothetical protein [Lactococcus lactis]|uniref:hypothetical protein n=1 Tax=Lactococcus lactis TaxID=1358 RepID=UPI0020570DD9|nr:hypothetical protein [Lactococcus lactis]WKF72855.1 hypothetical protein QYM42_10820 [Lactococcus lactis]BDH82372.1 hypothetical protein LLL8_20290 [Lactococcus lactis]
MSKALITDEEYRRFEDIIFKVWRVYEFGENEFTQAETEHINIIFEQLNAEHPRECKIIVRHHLKRVYYTTMAREQEVSEGYIRKLAKNGAYYFLQIYDDK